MIPSITIFTPKHITVSWERIFQKNQKTKYNFSLKRRREVHISITFHGLIDLF